MAQFVFRALPDEEFRMLSIEQKLAYLHEAFKALMARESVGGVEQALDILEQIPSGDQPLQ
jgi:hypothetical protein